MAVSLLIQIDGREIPSLFYQTLGQGGGPKTGGWLIATRSQWAHTRSVVVGSDVCSVHDLRLLWYLHSKPVVCLLSVLPFSVSVLFVWKGSRRFTANCRFENLSKNSCVMIWALFEEVSSKKRAARIITNAAHVIANPLVRHLNYSGADVGNHNQICNLSSHSCLSAMVG